MEFVPNEQFCSQRHNIRHLSLCPVRDQSNQTSDICELTALGCLTLSPDILRNKSDSSTFTFCYQDKTFAHKS